MKKISLLLSMMLLCIYSFASVVQGTLTLGNGFPAANATVWVTDSINVLPGFSLNTTTNANGEYSVTLPSTVTNGTTIMVSTAGCQGAMLMNYHVYGGVDITSDFVVCSSNPNPVTIAGQVTLPSSSGPATGLPGYPAIVYLIEEDYDSSISSYILTAVDSTTTDTMGHFQFVYQSNTWRPLLAKAALLPASPDYNDYLPTYSYQSLNWSGAAVVNGGSAAISMVAGVNPGGPGFIGGSVLQGANKSTAAGDPLNMRLIMLTTASGQAVAYTYSDANGAFSFSNLAYGTYKLFGDAWGKQNPALTVTISAAQPSVNNVVFEENSDSFGGELEVTAIGETPLNDLMKVFPNPATDKLTISGLGQLSGVKSITLTGMNGAIVYSTQANMDAVSLPVSQLANGVYLLKVQSTKGAALYKVIK